jgi:SAM-dependent methyltransferase
VKGINPKVISILECQFCNSNLKLLESSFVCVRCGAALSIQNGVVVFINGDPDGRATEIGHSKEDIFYSNNTIKVKLYEFGRKIVSCDYVVKDYLKEFLGRIKKDAIVVELGSGNRRCKEDIINVDLFPFPNVDVLSDIKKTPFGDNTVDYLIVDAVLEHVPEPQTVCKEMYRILKRGGMIFCVVPLVHQYHAHPRHYFNITEDGLRYLFKEFSKCDVKLYRGPTSAIISLIAEYFALAFSGNHNNLYLLIRGLVLLPIFWLKYLDKFWFYSHKSTRICNALCAIVTK